jgi:hypothetical protein
MQRFSSTLQAILKMKLTTILLVFCGFVLFAWFTSIAMAPLNKKGEYQKLVYADSVFTESFDSIYYQPEISHLIKDKAYKEALIKLAESDSIQLVINLSDSTVNLSLKGVMIHQTKVSELHIDIFLRKVSLMQELKFFSQPLIVHSQYSTIVKEPVVVRHAPKDTTEAALNAWQPDTLVQNPAFMAFSVEHSIQVIFEQEDNKSAYDKWKKFGFYSHLLYRKTITSLERFLSLKPQEYKPTITIKMPVDDLRAIYRALPENTFVVIKL